MNSLELAQMGVKLARYVPFGVYAVVVILSRVVLSPRQMRAAVVMGCAGGLGMVGWLARYFLEQSSPVASYAVVPTPGAVVSIALPELVHDMAGAGALVVAFVAVAALVPKKEGSA